MKAKQHSAKRAEVPVGVFARDPRRERPAEAPEMLTQEGPLGLLGHLERVLAVGRAGLVREQHAPACGSESP